MNKLEAFNVTAPDGKTDECAKFTINDANSTFTFTNIASVDQDYVLHYWIKSDATGAISFFSDQVVTSAEWSESVHKFKAAETDLVLTFATPGVYYLYNSKLEIGTIPTDWTPAPEDVQQGIEHAQTDANNANNKLEEQIPNIEFAKSQIEILNKSIASLVVDQNGGSLMTQTSDGWQFNIGAIQSSLNGAIGDIQEVQGDISGVKDLADKTNELANDVAKKTAYINMTQDESGQPVMELGQQNGEFKLRITNTSMDFMQGSQRIAYLSNRQLYIQSSVVTDEMKIGAGAGFIWKKRANGNMGLRYVTS